MAASHICMSCGGDLARTRAVVEPRYGLPVVVCPSCAAVFVRRMHPLTARWRATARALAAVRAIAVRIAVASGLMLASVGLVYLVDAGGDDLGVSALALPWMLLDAPGTHRGLPNDAWYAALTVAGAWLAVEIGVGILLGAGLRHWRRRWALWGMWAALLVIFLSLEPGVQWMRSEMSWLTPTEEAARPGWAEWSARLVYGLGALAAAPLGVPAGKGLSKLNVYLRNLKLRLRRRRIKRLRGWAA